MTEEANWLPRHTTLGTVTIGGRECAAKRGPGGEVWYRPTPHDAMVRAWHDETRRSFRPLEEES